MCIKFFFRIASTTRSIHAARNQINGKSTQLLDLIMSQISHQAFFQPCFSTAPLKGRQKTFTSPLGWPAFAVPFPFRFLLAGVLLFLLFFVSSCPGASFFFFSVSFLLFSSVSRSPCFLCSYFFLYFLFLHVSYWYVFFCLWLLRLMWGLLEVLFSGLIPMALLFSAVLQTTRCVVQVDSRA